MRALALGCCLLTGCGLVRYDPLGGGGDAGDGDGNGDGSNVDATPPNPFAGCGQPGYLICDDFESSPGAFTNSDTAGGGTIVFSTAQSSSGSSAMRVAIPGDVGRAFKIGNILHDTGPLWIQAWARFPNSFTFSNGERPLVIVAQVPTRSLQLGIGNAGFLSIGVYDLGAATFTLPGGSIPRGEWVCLRARVSLAIGAQFTLWINDNLVADMTSTADTSGTTYNQVNIGLASRSGDPALEYDLDDVVISSVDVSCDGS